MSRTVRGSKGSGHDFWSKRPYSGSGHGPVVKKLTHRAERQQGLKACAEDFTPSVADDAYWGYETAQLDRIYGGGA